MPAEQVEKELPNYVLQLQQEYLATMKSFLRDLGLRQPITDLNFRDNMVYALPRSQLDYVDVHAYWALYKNLPGAAKSRVQPYRQTWGNPNAVGWSYYLGPVACRLFDRPCACSEYNGCYATPYWGFVGPVEAALAGLQGWNAVFRCGAAPDQKRFFSPTPVRTIESTSNPLILLSERIGAMLFAQGELKPHPIQVPLVLTPEYLRAKVDLTGGPKNPPEYQKLAFRFQLGTIVLDGHERLDGYPCLVAPADMPLPATLSGKKVLRADSSLATQLKEIFPNASEGTPLNLDTAHGTAQIVTPRTETFLLPAEIGSATGQCVTVEGNQTVAVCFAGSLDGRPLAESGRMLALYLTDVKNTDTEVEYEAKPKDNVIVRNPGRLPLLVHQGRIEWSFQIKDRPLPHIWALKFDGSRAKELQPHRTAAGFSFEAKAVTDPETFCAYELEWEREAGGGRR